MLKTILKVREIPNDFQFVVQDTKVAAIKEYFPVIAVKFDSFFVKLDSSGADYESIYGMEGVVPNLDKLLWKIL